MGMGRSAKKRLRKAQAQEVFEKKLEVLKGCSCAMCEDKKITFHHRIPLLTMKRGRHTRKKFWRMKSFEKFSSEFDKLIPLCEYHHQMVHGKLPRWREGRKTLEHFDPKYFPFD